MLEVLAPVGSFEMAQAAVHSGAQAIYVGFPGFNARGRTPDFDLETFGELVALCRFHGVHIYVAFNVLVFESEWPSILAPARELIALGIDAFIVQDLGVARLLRRLSPNVRLHASTQMTVTAPQAIDLTADLKLSRYVLARELSLEEISAVRKGTDSELEVFVHGALCVSYSGQCLTSESFGGRSANRGQCAQSCRLDYDLIVDGVQRDLGEKRYLVSPQDLCGLEEIPALMAMGVNSFKIEGRLKTPAYVAAASQAYRKAIDAVQSQSEFDLIQAKNQLAITYSRGFFSGWLHGVDHQALVPATYGHHRGLALGEVIETRKDTVRVAEGPQAGDGMLFLPTPGTPSDQGVAGRVYSVQNGWLAFDFALPIHKIKPGWVAYWNDSPALERALTAPLRDRNSQSKIAVHARVQGRVGESLTLTLSLFNGSSAGKPGVTTSNPFSHSITVMSELPLATASKAPFTLAAAREELESMQVEGFQLAQLEFAVEGDVFVHGKAWRKQRQSAVAALKAARLSLSKPKLVESSEVLHWAEAHITALKAHGSAMVQAPSGIEGATATKPVAQLHVLLRDLAQCQALCAEAESTSSNLLTENQVTPEVPLAHTVFLDFEYGRDYKPALEMLRKAGFQAGIATTRIMKPLEKHHLTVIEKLCPDAVLVRNLAALQALRPSGLPLIGDFSLNAANSLSTDYLLSKGLQRLTPSYDLNQNQLLDLLLAAGGQHFEITLHQYLPAFHMEHCVFAGFLSQGHSYKDCGKPCERHQVALRDHTGALHPLKADQECRNTMFHGTPQSSARLLPQWLEAGVRHFRLEFLWENGAEVLRHLRLYRSLFSGSQPAGSVFAELKVGERYGVSEGQLRQTAVWRDRKKS